MIWATVSFHNTTEYVEPDQLISWQVLSADNVTIYQ